MMAVCVRPRLCVCVCVCVCVCMCESLWWSSAVLICQSHLTHSTDIIHKLQNHTQNIYETDFTKSLDVEIKKILCTFCKNFNNAIAWFILLSFLRKFTRGKPFFTFTLPFSHLADAFIQSDLQIRKSN